MFQFSLEKVLVYRKQVEEEKQRLFGMARAELYEAVHQLEELKKEKVSQMDEWAKVIEEGLNVGLHNIYTTYVADLNERIEQKGGAIIRFNQVFEKARRQMLSALKDRKILDELRVKELLEYNEKMKKVEAKELGEIAIITYNRR